jgi:hypothetical protein
MSGGDGNVKVICSLLWVVIVVFLRLRLSASDKHPGKVKLDWNAKTAE